MFTLFKCANQNSSIHVQKKIELTLFDVSIDTISGEAIRVQEKRQGYEGIIYSKNVDSILFNFGYDINNLAEKDPAVFFLPNPPPINNIDTSIIDPQNVIFTNRPNFDIDEFRKQNVYFDTVAGLHAKITVPRRKGSGITGVYIDSITSDAGGRLKFNFYAKDLDSIKQEVMLKAIRSIKLKAR